MTAIRRRDPSRRIARARPISVEEANSALLSLLYETVGKADGWATFINSLARSYGGGKATLLAIDPGVRKSSHIATGQWEPEQNTRYARSYGANNPWVPRVGNRPTGMVTTLERVLPRSELFKTEHYNDFLQPAQVDSGVAVTIQKDGSRYFSISVLFPQVRRSVIRHGRPAATPSPASPASRPAEPAIGRAGNPGRVC